MLISGPVNLHVLYSIHDKHYIYIFGDIHEDLKYLCKNKKNLIWDFLYNLIIFNTDKFFNFFIETYQINDDINYINTNIDCISNIIKKFNNFSLIKKKTFNNAMIHYIDYRIMISHSFISNKFHINYKNSYNFFHNIELIDNTLLHLILMYYENTYDLTNLYSYISSLSNIFSHFNTFEHIYSISDYINIFKKYINYSKIIKQFSNISNKFYVNLLYKYLNNYLNFILNKYNNLNFNNICHIINHMFNNWHIFKNKKTFFTLNHINNLYLFYTFNFELQLILMDLYAMGRLLRHFKEYDIFKNNDKYSILYVGKKHADLYITLLKQMNFNILYKSSKFEKKNRCIYIDDKAFSHFNLS